MVELQKKLGKKQLAQYERDEMFGSTGNIGMTTRQATSAARNAGQGFMPRLQPTMMQTMETSFSTPTNASMVRNMATNESPHTPTANIMRNSPSASAMMTETPHNVQFGRNYASRYQLDMGDSSGGGNSTPRRSYVIQYTNPVYSGFHDGAPNEPAAATSSTAAATIKAMKQGLSPRTIFGGVLNQLKRQARIVEPEPSPPTSSSTRRNLTFTNPAYMGDFDAVGDGTGGAVDMNFSHINRKLTARQRFDNALNRVKAAVGAEVNPRQRFDTATHRERLTNARERLTNAMNRMNPRERITNALNRFRRARQAAAAEEIPLVSMEHGLDEDGNPGIRPVDGSIPRTKFLRFANMGKMQYPNVMKMVREKIQRHKRKLMVAGGVLGAAALVGGIVGGTLSQQSKKRRKEMQHESSIGVFERLSDSSGVLSGGGGGGGGSSGGGYGNYQGHMYEGGQTLQTKKRRQYKKRKGKNTKTKGKQRSRRHSGNSSSKKVVKRGRIVKRKRINKQHKKHSKKSKQHSEKAF